MTAEELPLPASSAEMTAEWLNRALGSAGVLDGAEIVSVDRKVIGEDVGFVGELSRLTLSYARPPSSAPATLIAKLPTGVESVRTISQLFGFYEREVRFYQQLAGQITLRTPRCYVSAMDPAASRFVLLLEDLAPARGGDQLASCSLADAELAINEIAALHAAWWNSPRLQELDWLPAIDDPLLIPVLQALYQASWPFFVEQSGEQVSPEILPIGERFGASFGALAAEVGKRPRTIVHTDFRLDNMFFDLPDGSPFALIDWQIVQRALGPADVTYFLAGSFPPDVRRQHEQRLLRSYHDALLRNGVTGYSFDQCWEEYRLSALFFFIFLVTGRQNVDMSQYGDRAQALFDMLVERYATAILDLKAEEFLPA